MANKAKQLALGLFIRAHGHHLAAWKQPNVPNEAGLTLAHYRNIVTTAERAKLDFVFLADSMGVRASVQPDAAFERTPHLTHFEPITLLSALATFTQHIGLVATASTTYYEPFHVARLFASLDYLSGGRAAWNVVTSNGVGEAENFSAQAHPKHDARYARAIEFLDVVKKLWDSWEDDAFTWNENSGVVFDKSKLHQPNHVGEHFSVAGPLNVSRPPQGHPIIVQAGGSGPGIELAALTADVVFAVHPTLADGQAFYSKLKGRLSDAGRDPASLKIMPGIFPVVGRSRAEADEKYAQLQESLDPVLAISQLSNLLDGVDLSGYPLDGPVPDLPGTNASVTRLKVLRETAERDGLNLLQLAQRIAGSRGHHQVFGTAADIADRMEEWFHKEAADGFNLLPATLPGGLEDFAELVVPELQRRGLFRTEYSGASLRENLGLSRPVHPALRTSSAA
ncbi:LLM class flavin-dependent oxidoreductase [Uliginosibacterium sp. H3]|uniref:LLM class flavin-dependent oxidoreductase n=1 Tax=Uliginosibacterium silvisoli TaxID=3114758 RepID=A0ABU6K4F7_9RHOO|nr:LLM class flavin-dependent oxidoreductase [Uliginosibacterium sp. H3]